MNSHPQQLPLPLPPPTTTTSATTSSPHHPSSSLPYDNLIHHRGPLTSSVAPPPTLTHNPTSYDTLIRSHPQPQHYFRPISQHSRQYDFDTDSDAISSPTSSMIGPPPPITCGVISNMSQQQQQGQQGNGGSAGYLNGSIQMGGGQGHGQGTSSQGHGGQGTQGWLTGIFSPPSLPQCPTTTTTRFDESSFLATSDACSSPETGSLPRVKHMAKRKRPPRPPPRRLKSDDYLPEGEEDEDHLRHLMASGRCIPYGSWPRDTPSPVASSAGYQQQLAVMSLSMGGRLEQELVEDSNTALALSEIRTQLQELTKSVESCQGEVTDVKKDMITIRSDIRMIHHVKEELDDVRECVDRLEEITRTRNKTRLLEQGLTIFLCFSIFTAVLGMLQFGYNTGVINAPKQEITQFMKTVHYERTLEKLDDSKIGNWLYSIVVAIFAIGGMLGAFSGGSIANRFGRKGGLLLNNLLGITGGSLMWLSQSSNFYEILIIGRFIIGIHCGINTVLVPMYVSEIAPLNLRGALGTVNQLAVCIGLLSSQILGIEQLLGTLDGWSILLGLTAAPAILQILLLPMCVESPRYLFITKQREDEARRALRRLRASPNIEEDINEMKAEIQMRAELRTEQASMLQLLRSSTLRSPLCIAIVMQLSQQLSGINAVLYYSTDFFIRAGLTAAQAKFATIGIGAIMVGMTLVSIMLMDRAGRRSLHLYGLGGMFVFSLFITIAMLCKEILNGISYLAVIFTLSFVVFFAVGPGSIPWLITAELFSQGPRPSAMAIASLTNWLANFLVSISFLWMQENLSSYVFLPFSVLLAIFWTFTYRKVPETKNKTFEEISALFKRNHSRAESDDSHIYGTLNCVNSTMVQPESSALIVGEEKHAPESCEPSEYDFDHL